MGFATTISAVEMDSKNLSGSHWKTENSAVEK